MKRHLSAVAALGFLAACSSQSGVHEHHFDRGVVPAADEFSLEAAERLCDIDSLAAQRESMIREVSRSEFDARQLIGPDETRESDVTAETRSITPQPPFMNPPSETLELVRAFVIDLDASYRFATQSCQAYAMCMHQNRYDEDACANTRSDWSRAQDRFTGMSDRLADVREVIATQCPDCYPYARGYGYGPHHPSPRPRPYRHRRHHHAPSDKDDCDGVLGDVFTTNTDCRDDDCRGRRCAY